MRAAVAGSRPDFAISGGVVANASTSRSAEKMSIGTSTSTGPGRPDLRQVKRALDDARQIADVVDAIDALAERPVDLELIRVLVQVHFLVRMASVVVARDVAGDHHHRDRVERRVGDAGRRIGEARTEVRHQDADLARRARVAVGGVRGDLLVARRDEANLALAERVEKADHGVAAQPEDHLDAEALEVVGQQVRRDARLGFRRDALDGGLCGDVHGA